MWQPRNSEAPARFLPWLATVQMKTVHARPPRKKPARNNDALRVLVAIYHALLKRIELADYDVFSRRASVPLRQKLAILMVGLTRMAWARLFA